MKLPSLILAALLLASSSLVAFQNRGIPGLFSDDDDDKVPLSPREMNQKTAEW